MIFSVYATWDAVHPVDAEILAQISSGFRPDDDAVCVWSDTDAEQLVKLSIDVEAPSYEEALALGQRLLSEAAASVGLTGSASEVVAVTEEGQATWVP